VSRCQSNNGNKAHATVRVDLNQVAPSVLAIFLQLICAHCEPFNWTIGLTLDLVVMMFLDIAFASFSSF
jgi:hypothetical protein